MSQAQARAAQLRSSLGRRVVYRISPQVLRRSRGVQVARLIQHLEPPRSSVYIGIIGGAQLRWCKGQVP